MLQTKIQVEKVTTLLGHTDCVYALACNTGSGLVYSSGADGLVVQWNLAEPEGKGLVVAKVPNSVYALCYNIADGNLLVAQNFEGLHIINPEQRTELCSVKLPGAAIFDVQVYNNLVYVCTGDGGVYILDYVSLKKVNFVKYSDKSARCAAMIPEFGLLAVGYSDHTIRILNAETLELVKTIPAHNNSVFTLAYFPASGHLVSGSRDAHLKVWHAPSDFSLQHSIVAHTFAINQVALSPDGLQFVTCSMDKSVKVWDAEQFRLLKVIDRARHAGHGTSVNRVCYTGFNNYLVACSDDRSISVWNIN
jgi:WD40 repeat protein